MVFFYVTFYGIADVKRIRQTWIKWADKRMGSFHRFILKYFKYVREPVLLSGQDVKTRFLF
jgi:hypothetical protein